MDIPLLKAISQLFNKILLQCSRKEFEIHEIVYRLYEYKHYNITIDFLKQLLGT